MSKYRIIEVIGKDGCKEYHAQVRRCLFFWIGLYNPEVTHTNTYWHDDVDDALETIRIHKQRKQKPKFK